MPPRADLPAARRRPAPGGFTLLEVLVALVIVSSTLLLCYRVGSSAIGAVADGESRYRAALLGESTVRNALAPFPAAGRSEGSYPTPDEAFRYELEVREAVHKDVREIHALVIWGPPGEEGRLDVAGVAVR